MMRVVVWVFSVFFCVLLAATAHSIPVVDGTFNQGEYASEFNGDGYIYPAYGGQPYDVEFMGLTISNNTLYFGLQTGFNLTPGSGNKSTGNFVIGDLMFDLDANGVFETAIRFGKWPGLTLLNQPGIGDTALIDFGLFKNVPSTSLTNVVYSQNSVSNPLGIRPTNPVLPYTLLPGAGTMGIHSPSNGPGPDDDNPPAGAKSFVLEGSFDLTGIWNGYSPITFHWTMGCGNDMGEVTTPEPATIVMAGTGLLGIVFGRRRLRRFLQ